MKKLPHLLTLLLLSGCFTTRVASPGFSFDTVPESAVHTDRQWFTLDGLVKLSHPAGNECPHGMVAVESGLAGTDILINLGLSLLGGTLTYAACDSNDTSARLSCAATGASLAPFLLGSRTVRYVCRDDVAPLPVQPPPSAPPIRPEDVPANLQPPPDAG